MIGRIATRPKQSLSALGIQEITKIKESYAKIYQKVLPSIIIAGSSQTHPCHSLCYNFCIQIVHFMSNTQQPDSPDVSSLLNCLLSLLSSPKQISDFVSFLFGQFIKWNIKQNVGKVDYEWPVVKMALRGLSGIMSREGVQVILLLLEVVNNIKRQKSIINKYLLQFFNMCLILSRSNSTLQTLYSLINKLLALVRIYSNNLKIPLKSRKGRFQCIFQLLDQLYNKLMDKEPSVREIAWYLWYRIIDQSNYEKSHLQILIEKGQKQQTILFKQIIQIDGLKEIETLTSYVYIWNKLIQAKLMQNEDIVQLTQFKNIVIPQTIKTLKFLQAKQIFNKNQLFFLVQVAKIQSQVQQIFSNWKSFIVILFTAQLKQQLFEVIVKALKISGKVDVNINIEVFLNQLKRQSFYLRKRKLLGLKYYIQQFKPQIPLPYQPFFDFLLPYAPTSQLLYHIQQQSIEFQKHQIIFINLIVNYWDQYQQIIIKKWKDSYYRWMIAVIRRLSGMDIINLAKKLHTIQLKPSVDLYKFFFIILDKFKIMNQKIPEILLNNLVRILKEIFNSDLQAFQLLQAFELYGKMISIMKANPLGNQLGKIGLRFPTSIEHLEQKNRMQFKLLLKCFCNLIKLAQSVQMFGYIFVVIRQKMKEEHEKIINSTIQTYIHQTYKLNQQSQQLMWAYQTFKNYKHHSYKNNIKQTIIKKLLIPLINNSKTSSVIQFYNNVNLQLLKFLDNRKQLISINQPQSLAQWIVIRRTIYLILSNLYSGLPSKNQQPNIHKQQYKQFIKHAIVDVKKQFEKVRELNDIVQGKQLLRSLSCYAYNCLMQIFICTQSNKQNFRNYLFTKKGDQKLWEAMVVQNDFNFQIQTNFKEIEQHKKSQPPKFSISDKISFKYFSASLLIQPQHQGNYQKKIPAMDNQVTSKKIELDVLNQHEIMLTLLKLIDFMFDKFDKNQQETPGWILSLFESWKLGSLGIQIFILKVILNRKQIFYKWGKIWIEPIIQYCSYVNKGGKYFNYFLRDVTMCLIQLLDQYQLPLTTSILRDYQLKQVQFLIKVLPNANHQIYSQNINILKRLLEKYKDRIFIKRSLVEAMCKFKEKDGEKKQLSQNDWRMNGFLVFAIALDIGIPILQNVQQFLIANNQKTKFKYLQQLQGRKYFVHLIEMVNLSIKKYQKCVGLFLGMLFKRLQSIIEFQTTLQGYVHLITISLLSVFSSNNRTTKQKFPLILSQISKNYPAILSHPKLFAEVDSMIHKVTRQQSRGKVFFIIRNYINNCKQRTVDFQKQLEQLIISLRGSANSLFQQNQNVHTQFLKLLLLLSQKSILEYSIQTPLLFKYLVPQMPYHRSENIEHIGLYYQILMNLFQFFKEHIEEEYLDVVLVVKGKLVNGLKNQHVHKKIFELLDSQSSESLYQRLNYLFKDIFHPEYERSWLTTAVSLILSIGVKSSDYQRLLFQQPLDSLASYYDWDFRNPNVAKQYITSQPFQPTFMMSQSNSVDYSQTSNEGIQLLPQGYIKSTFVDQVPLFRNNKIRKANPYMKEFYATNQLTYSQVEINSTGNVRFVKEKKRETRIRRKEKGLQFIRKYKMGDLPYIQIAWKDVIDPLNVLAFQDQVLAGELFISLFMQAIKLEIPPIPKLLINSVRYIILQSTQFTYNVMSTLIKILYEEYKLSGQMIKIDWLQISKKSNTFDVAISLVEVGEKWMEGLDMYKLLYEEDQVKGILMKVLPQPFQQLLSFILEEKGRGKYQSSRQSLANLIDKITEIQSVDRNKIKQYLQQEKNQCEEVLLQWNNIYNNVSVSKVNDLNQIDPKKVVLLFMSMSNAGKNNQLGQLISHWSNYPQMKKTLIQNYAYQYNKFILSNSQQFVDYNQCIYNIKTAQSSFYNKWSKYGLYASGQKHQLIQQIQKYYQMQEFITVIKNGNQENCLELLNKWKQRTPSYIHDSHLTWLQILESRQLFSKLLGKKYNISTNVIFQMIESYLVQMANGMVKKGFIGTAKPIMRKANLIKKQLKNTIFNWDFYKATLKLCLKQLQINNWSLKIKDRSPIEQYEKILNLTQKQLPQLPSIRPKFIVTKMEYYESYLQKYFEFANVIPFAQEYSNTLQKVYFLFIGFIEQIQRGEDIKINKKVYYRFTIFCQRILRIYQVESQYKDLIRNLKINKDSPLISVQLLANNFITYIIKSLQLLNAQQTKTVSSLILKMIKIIQTYYSQLGPYFFQAISKDLISVKLFLPFIPQIINVLSFEKIVPYFQTFFLKIIDQHPQSLIYHFNTLFEFKQNCRNAITQKIFTALRTKLPQYFNFIKALNMLTYPEHRLQEHLSQIKELFIQLKKSSGNQKDALKNKIQLQLQKIYIQFGVEKCEKKEEQQKYLRYMGKYNREFARQWMQRLNNIQNIDIIKQIHTLQQSIRKLHAQKGKLSDFSTYFEDYSKPVLLVPNKKIYIHSFYPQVLIMQSIRKPKRLEMWGTDQKKYYWLVKGCQDVRLDQRIQQIFQVINQILRTNSQCIKRQLQISTYEVIPLTKNLGLIEWLVNTKVIKDIIQFQYLRTRKIGNLEKDNEAYKEKIRYFYNKNKKEKSIAQMNQDLLRTQSQQIIDLQTKLQNLLPQNMLRNALEKLAINLQSYFYLKNRFLRNYSLICLSGYILGIGDRHLHNFLMNYKTAEVISIDFGFSFGAGINNFIPQLIPFRMTKVFRQLTQPIGVNGNFKQGMFHALTAIKKKNHNLLDFCEVFIIDPVMDWIKISRATKSRDLQKHIEMPSYISSCQSIDPTYLRAQDRKIYWQRIEIVRKKILGFNGKILMLEQLEHSRHRHSDYYNNLKNIVLNSGSKRNEELFLGVNDQIDILLDMALDKNLLGRLWIGWCSHI